MELCVPWGEAFPVAARLSEMGMPVFCLNYRVAGKEPLFPKPMEDLSAAYRFLKDHEDQFDIDARHYAVGGFSAGGHLAACWGLKGTGICEIRISGCRNPHAGLSIDLRMENHPSASGTASADHACRIFWNRLF